MRIGILTLPLHTNYGGILQAYALQTVLERMGHEVQVFDTPNIVPTSGWKVCVKFTIRMVRKFVLCKKNVDLFCERTRNHETIVLRQFIQPFIDSYINRFEVSDLTTLNAKDYDALVVGSDQIWRRDFNKNIENVYFAFARQWKVRRLSYAASFGFDDWRYSEKERRVCAKLVKMFDLVTVREESGVELCSKFLGVKASHVLDPTMLLDKKDYEDVVCAKAMACNDGEMLAYFINPTDYNLKFVSDLGMVKEMRPFFVFSKVDDERLPLEERMQKPVEQWLRGFMDAKFVITDSFHACVFSIIFNVPFVVLNFSYGGIARIISILKIFRLEDRLVDNVNSASSLPPIDWEMVNTIRKNWVNKSVELLASVI